MKKLKANLLMPPLMFQRTVKNSLATTLIEGGRPQDHPDNPIWLVGFSNSQQVGNVPIETGGRGGLSGEKRVDGCSLDRKLLKDGARYVFTRPNFIRRVFRFAGAISINQSFSVSQRSFF